MGLFFGATMARRLKTVKVFSSSEERAGISTPMREFIRWLARMVAEKLHAQETARKISKRK